MRSRKKIIISAVVGLILILGTFLGIKLFKPAREADRNIIQSETENLFLEKPNKNLSKYAEENGYNEESLMNLLFIASGEMEKTNYEVKTDGVASPKLVVKMPDQIIKAIRQKQGNDYYHEIITYGPKNEASQIYISDGNNFVKTSKNIDKHNLTAVYDAKDVINYTDYDILNLMGIGSKSLSPYILNKHTVLSATLIQQSPNELRVKYTLDANKATYYYQNDVKSRGGSDKYPFFKYVEIEVVFTDNYLIKEMKASEEYELNIGATATITNTVLYTYTFEDFIFLGPDQFKDFMHLAQRPVEPGARDGLFYIQNALLGDLTRETGLTLVGEVKINDEILPVKFKMSMVTGVIKASVNDFLFIMSEGDTLYFKINNNTGKIISEDVNLNLGEQELELGSITNDLTVETEGSLVRVYMKLTDDITLVFNFDELEFINITGKFTVFNQDIEVNAFKSDEEITCDFTDAIDYSSIVDDIKSLVNNPNFEVELPKTQILTNEQSLPLYFSGLLNVNLIDGLNAEGQVSVLFNEEEYLIDVKIYDETIYLNYNDTIKVKLTFNDVTDLIQLIDENYELNFVLEYMQSYNNLKINDYLFAIIKSIELSNDPNNLSIKLNLGEEIGDVIASFIDDKIKVTFPLDINVFIKETEPVSVEKVNEDGYITYETVSKVLEDIKAFVNTNVYEFTFNTVIEGVPLNVAGQILNGETINFEIKFTYGDLTLYVIKDNDTLSFTLGDYQLIFENQEHLFAFVGLLMEKFGLVEVELLDQIEKLLTKESNVLAYLDSFKAKTIIDKIRFTENGVFLNLDNNLIQLLDGQIKLESGLNNPTGAKNVLTVIPKDNYVVSDNNAKKQLLLTDQSLALFTELISMFIDNNNLNLNVSFASEELTLDIDVVCENLLVSPRLSANGLVNINGEELSFKLYLDQNEVILKVGPVIYGMTIEELKELISTESLSLEIPELEFDPTTIIGLVGFILDTDNVDIDITDELLSVEALKPSLDKIGLQKLSLLFKESTLFINVDDLELTVNKTDKVVETLLPHDYYQITLNTTLPLLDNEVIVTGDIYLNLKTLDINGVLNIGDIPIELTKLGETFRVKVLDNTFEFSQEVLMLLINEFVSTDQVTQNNDVNGILNTLDFIINDNEISLLNGLVSINQTALQEVTLPTIEVVEVTTENYQVLVNLVNRLMGLNKLSGNLNIEGLNLDLSGNLDLTKGMFNFNAVFDYQGITGSLEGGLANEELTLLAFNTYFKISISEILSLLPQSEGFTEQITINLTSNELIVTTTSFTLTYDNLLDKVTITGNSFNIIIEEGLEPVTEYNPTEFYVLSDLLEAKDLVLELLKVTERDYYHISFTGDVENLLVTGVFKYLKASQTYEINVTLTDKTTLDVHDLKFMENNGNVYFNYNGLKVLMSQIEFYSIIDLVLTHLEIAQKDQIMEIVQNKTISLDNMGDMITNVNLDELINNINLSEKTFSVNTTEGDLTVTTLGLLPKINLLLNNANLEVTVLDTAPVLSTVVDSQFHNFNNSYNLVQAALNTVNLKTYTFNGNLKLNMLIYNFEVSDFLLKIDNREAESLKIYAEFTVPRTVIVTDCETHNKIYIKDGYVYLDQIKKTYKLSWFQWKLDKTEYIKRLWTKEEFEANLVDNIMMMFNFNSIITDQVDKQTESGSEIDVSKILKEYTPVSGEHYRILVDGNELTSGNLKDITLNIYLVDNLLNKLDIATGYSIFSITGSFTMQPYNTWTDIDFSTFGNL